MTIETLDFKMRGSAMFSMTLHRSLSTTGFFLLKNHGIRQDLLMEARDLFMQFFKLPVDVKMQYAHPELHNQLGYVPNRAETGEFAKVADNKELFHFGDTHKMVYVPEIPKLKKIGEKALLNSSKLYGKLMQEVAITLNLRRGYFDRQLGDSLFSFNYYPADPNPVVRDEDVEAEGVVADGMGMCAARHTDINDLTLLHAITPGLQLWYRNKWVPIVANPDTIIVNTGDMLQHLTGGRYKSGLHRVVCEPGVERISSPFFGHRKPRTSIVPLKHLGPSDLKKYHFKTEGPYLRYRLKQIFGKK